MSLKPTHIQFKAEGKKQYAQLKSDTNWGKAKKTAEAFPPESKAKAVRRK